MQRYNPIIRTFTRLRASLIRLTGRPRSEIRPSTPLHELLPVAGRRAIWAELEREWPRMERLTLPVPIGKLVCCCVLLGTIASAAALQQVAALAVIVPLTLVIFTITRPWVVAFPIERQTVGDLVLQLVQIRDHRACGYRWTRNEIAFKVRWTLCEACNVPFHEITLDKTLIELTGP